MKNSHLSTVIRILVSCFKSSHKFSISYGDFEAALTPAGYRLNEELSLLQRIRAVGVSGNKIYLDFSNQLVYSTRLYLDSLDLYSRHPSTLADILSARKSIIGRSSTNILSIILVGSYARGTESPSSDTDFVVISRRPLKRIKPQHKPADIIRYSPTQFTSSVYAGDEFVLWGLKYGLIVFDAFYLQKNFLAEGAQLQGLIARKNSTIERLIYSIVLGLSTERWNILGPRIADLYNQILRLSILCNGEIPLSAKELFTQFKEIKQQWARVPKFSDHNKLGLAQKDRATLLQLFFSLKEFYYSSLRDRVYNKSLQELT